MRPWNQPTTRPEARSSAVRPRGEFRIARAGALEHGLDLLVGEGGAEQGAALGVLDAVGRPRPAQELVPGEERGPQRSSGVARGRLDPEPVEDLLPQDAAVAHAVQGDASGQAEVLEAGLAPDVPRHPEHDLLRGFLDRGRQVHVALGRGGLGRAGRAAEQVMEAGVRHGQARAVVEEAHVRAEGAVLAQVHQALEDELREARLAVRGQAHDLVLARVDLEAGVVGESRVEQPEGVGEAHLAEERDGVAPPDPEGGRRPFPDAVHGQDGGLLERRGEEGGGGMGFVVLGEEELPVVAQLAADLALGPELAPQPEGHGLGEGGEARRGVGEVGLQDPLELQPGLVVEDDPVEVRGAQARLAQAVVDRVEGEGGVMLLAGEALLLRGGDDRAVAQQRRGGVVVVGGEPQDVHLSRRRPGSDRAGGGSAPGGA